MFESIGRSLTLVKASWDILMDDKKLLAFPILSGFFTLLVLATFILPLFYTKAFESSDSLMAIVMLFLFYVVSYFVVIFFNTSLISCVYGKLNGKPMSVGEGLSNSVKHFPAILGWAIVAATVGLILNLLQEKAGFIGDIVLALIGGVWSLVTYFVVPVLILEDKGVFDSLKGSLTLIKKTWGESMIGAGSIAIIFVVIGIIGFICVMATVFFPILNMLFLPVLGLFLLLVIILAVLYSAMQGIFVTVLYTYAKTGTVPSGFNPDLIKNAFVPKPGSNQGNI